MREKNVEILRIVQEERQEMNFTRNDEDDDEQEEPQQPKPRINTIKVLKVDLEEEENDSKWLNNFLLAVSVQVIIQFLYGSYSRRRREQKEKITADESKSGGDESIEEDEEEEFELIQGEASKPEETPKDSQARGSQEDPKDHRSESEEEGKILFVTRYGEVYHLHEDFEKTKGYAKYQRFPCKVCKA